MLGSTRNHILVIAAVLVAVGASGCAFAPPTPAPHVTKPHHYAQGGVEFAYPANWDLFEKVRESEDVDGEVRSISVGLQGQAGAVLRVMSPPPPELDLREFGESFANNIKERLTSVMKLERSAERMVDVEVAGEQRQGIRKELVFAFMFSKLPITIDFFTIEGDESAAFLVTFSMEEGEKAERAFELIRTSLRVY